MCSDRSTAVTERVRHLLGGQEAEWPHVADSKAHRSQSEPHAAPAATFHEQALHVGQQRREIGDDVCSLDRPALIRPLAHGAGRHDALRRHAELLARFGACHMHLELQRSR